PTTSRAAARLACPAARVKYPATRTVSAAARMTRLRRVSRKRRAAGPPPAEVTEGRELGIRQEATTDPGLGQVQVPVRFRGRRPSPRRAPPGGPDPAGAGAGPAPPPAGPRSATRRPRSPSCPACTAAGRRAAILARTGP